MCIRDSPKGSATRAEIAVIVARLLLPGQRIGHDNRVHPVMSSQMGNYMQGSLAIESGSIVYFPFRNDQEPDETRQIGVLARKADGSTCLLYTSPASMFRNKQRSRTHAAARARS